MGKNRTFTAKVGGTSFEIPTTMKVLYSGAKLSECSLAEALAEGRAEMLVQGVICAGIEELGTSELNGEKIAFSSPAARKEAFEIIGQQCDFKESMANAMAFMMAMTSDDPEEDKAKAKNAKAEETQATSLLGDKSSDSPTDSSV